MCALRLVKINYITWLKVWSISTYIGLREDTSEGEVGDIRTMRMDFGRIISLPPHKSWHNVELDESMGVSIKGSGFNLNSAQDAAALVEMIEKQKPLLYLELEGNTLGVEAAKEIGKSLESKPELVAALWKDLFTGRLKTEIPQALGYLLGGVDLAGARLTCLDLSDNAIGPIGMPGLVPFFKSKSSFSLQELIFNNNGWGPDGGSMLAESLLECYRKSLEEGGEVFQLKTFICGRSRIENKAGVALAEFFKEIKSLEEIHMPQNGIYTQGINALTDAFMENPNLRTLNLNDNTISPDGCINLARCLKSLVNLKELNLGDCLVKTAGVHYLSGPLSECKNLEKINLESNEIEDEGGIELANVLSRLPNLVEVNLCGNEFSNRAVDDIQKIFRSSIAKPTILIDSEESENWGEEGELGEEEEGNGTVSESRLEDDDTRRFLVDPTLANFKRLMPDPRGRLSDYLDPTADLFTGDRSYAATCVEAAFAISEFQDSTSKACFMLLLGKALFDPFFASYVLTRIGLLQVEDSNSNKRSVETVPVHSIVDLEEFIRSHKLSNATLASFHLFLQRYNSNTNETNTQIKNLFETVDTKLYG